MNTAIRESVFVQLRTAQQEIVRLKGQIDVLSKKCFALSNERSKWEHRYKNVLARLNRVNAGPAEQLNLYVDPQGNRITQDVVDMYRKAVQPKAAFTVAQVAAWCAANGIQP